jgi:hypothetical protein
LLFNFALEYAIRKVEANKGVLKLNGTHQLLVYADDVNMLGGSIHTIRKNTEALLIASKEIKVYRTIILPVVLYGCESWSLTWREECRLRVFENKVLRRIFGPKRN